MITQSLIQRATTLKLHGLICHWDDIKDTDWLEKIIQWEEIERADRGLERRLAKARLGRFKPLQQFDWNWPEQCDREVIEECLQPDFIKNTRNIILCGPNGVGKSTIACNIAYQAILKGYTALFVTAGEMLNNLAAQDSDSALNRRIKSYVQPMVLTVDEVGYLSYSNRHADLLFEIISRRYQEKPTIITTNKPFSEWNEIFPNASCVVSLIDRLVHRSEIINIVAKSFRLKEAEEEKIKREEQRAKRQLKNNSKK